MKDPKAKQTSAKKPASQKAVARKTAAKKSAKKPAAVRQRVKMIGDLERARSYLRAVTELGRRIHPLMTESELVERLHTAMENLFPDVAWVLRTQLPGSMDYHLRHASGLPYVLKEEVHHGQTAGSQSIKEGKIVHLYRHPLSEVAPDRTTTVIPLLVGFHVLGYMEVDLDGRDEEASRILEMLAGQFAVSLRTLQSAEESRNLENYLASVVDAASSIIIITGNDGRIRFFNRYAEKLSGYSREEVIGKNLLRVFKFHRGDRDSLRRAMADALAGVPIVNFEARYVAKNEEDRYALFNSAPLYDVKNHLTGVILTGVDLTEHKHLERQMMQSEKLASLGEMAAGIAHELNNPLTAIYTNADLQGRLAKTAGRDESEQRRIASILEGAERIRSLVRNLMGYARPSSEEMAPLDVNKLIEQSLSFCNYELTRNGVLLRRELGQNLPPVLGIAGQLQQVLVNLLTNASHAMAGRTGSITVRSDAGGDGVRLQIEDMGKGIAAEDLDKIFMPFYTTKPEGQGTGLGLSIVMRILQVHGARIEVRSRPNAGACFTLLFPPVGA